MKFIVYGYKMSCKHTHKYTHEGIYNAATSLGYETYWIDDNDVLDPLFFENSVIFTEGYVIKKLPVCKNSKYIIHHFGNRHGEGIYEQNLKYCCNNNQIIDLRFLCKKFKDHNYEWDVDFNFLNKIDDCTFLDSNNNIKIVYMPWATSVLPEDINFDDIFIPKTNKICFIGTIEHWTEQNPHPMFGISLDNQNRINLFEKICNQNKIDFVKISTWDNEISQSELKFITQTSLFAPDLKCDFRRSVGYIPCRVFKNISYGCLGVTDTKEVYNLLNGLVAYNENPELLFFEGMKYKNDIKLIKECMLLVKSKHTFINRVNSLLKCF